MNRLAITGAALALFTLPALGAEPPVGEYMCHDTGNAALGLFRILEPGVYEWQSVATSDFKTFKDDPSNGRGTYGLRADGWMEFTGAFAEAWQVIATWEQGWVWFSNEYGGVMRCGTALSG